MLKKILVGIVFGLECLTAFAGEGNVGVAQGKVAFVRRTTIVPMLVCEDNRPCVEPRTYWSLVIQAPETSYEVNATFAMGSAKQPSEVEFFGTRIRPGAQVAVEGRIETISDDYAIVTEVQKVTCLEEGDKHVGEADPLDGPLF
ncbi:MAG: hypothetical protein NDJ89_12035 [Oligoflexia bacterium]|nr:hypothetical protein [Oligoflexia bacterium]